MNTTYNRVESILDRTVDDILSGRSTQQFIGVSPTPWANDEVHTSLKNYVHAELNKIPQIDATYHYQGNGIGYFWITKKF